MPIMPEPSLVDQVNDLGWHLKRLQELKRLQGLENQNEDEKVADWSLKIEEFCCKIGYIEDKASQLLWRCNRRKGGFGFVKRFFTFLCRFRLPNLRLSISEVEKEMEKLEKEMEELLSSGNDKWIPVPMIRREQDVENGAVVVGREEDIRILLKFVEEESVDYPLFAVCGKGGLGKTTLVRKVYNMPDVRHKFMGCAWITAPHQVQAKTVWQDIMSQIEPGRKDEMKKLSDTALAQRLHSSLQSGRYLIVLDDVRSTEASLIALPTVGIRSRVVITTRETYQAQKIVKRIPHIIKMKPLTEDQSWELFLEKHLRSSHRSDFEKNLELEEICRDVVKKCDEFEEKPELKEICRDVVKKCKGVPLEIMVLGDLMAEKHSIDEWKLLDKKFSSAKDTLELSYNLLPGNLKSCLLYLAVFPKDTDTEAEKLYNLWIAEGLIKEDGNSSTMLSTAETYLKQLAGVGLVQVQEEETPIMLTKIKSWRLHDLVRELCCEKAKEESLFAAVDLRRAGNSNHQDTTRLTTDVRALAFYFDKRVGGYDFPNPNKFRKLRSFLFLNAPHPHHHLVPDEHLLLPKSLVLKDCRLLRVLDFNSLDFHVMKLPKDIQNLTTLRYLSFRGCNLQELSPSIGRLPNLEILDLRVNPTVDMSISNVLYKITRLKNLYFPQKFHAVGGKLQLDGLSELENLNNFASTRCRCKDLPRLTNLKYLAATIEGNQLDDLGETIKCIKEDRFKSSSIVLKNFDCYSHKRLSALSNLLGCENLNALRVEGHIGNLSCPISANLTQLFLLASEITEDPMPVLGEIPELQKLIICNGAYLGDAMDCKAHTFLQLRYLKLSNLDNLKDWTLEKGCMGKLSTLTVERCHSLENLPEGLKFLIHLREVNIVNMPQMSTTLKPEGQTQIQRFSGQYSDKIKHVLSINIL